MDAYLAQLHTVRRIMQDAAKSIHSPVWRLDARFVFIMSRRKLIEELEIYRSCFSTVISPTKQFFW
jgi:hypothetical protein